MTIDYYKLNKKDNTFLVDSGCFYKFNSYRNYFNWLRIINMTNKPRILRAFDFAFWDLSSFVEHAVYHEMQFDS